MSDVTVNASQALDGVTYASSGNQTADRLEQQEMGQSEFFKLLTTQLASQDPMNPMEDTAFISQMASFSELEMTSQLTDSFKEFTSVQQFAAAQGYIGKDIATSDGGAGTVTSIERINGQTLAFLNGSNTNGVDVNTIYKVQPSSSGSGDTGGTNEG